VQLVDPKAVARGLVRVSPGEDLVESLQALARVAGWQEALVTGAGQLDLVELAIDAGTVTLENAELAALSGRIVRRDGGHVDVVLRATVMVEGALRCGRIVAAMTGGLVLAVDAVLEAATVQRAAQPVPARPSANRTTPSPAPAVAESDDDGARSATKPLSQSFTTRPVVQRPTSPAFASIDENNPEVEPGDVIDHPQLGLCEVVGDDGSGGTRIRMISGRVRVLRLDALRVLPGLEDDTGRLVFRVAGPRRN
jgi:predicted DNA-binding protein with PD1-like motif